MQWGNLSNSRVAFRLIRDLPCDTEARLFLFHIALVRLSHHIRSLAVGLPIQLKPAVGRHPETDDLFLCATQSKAPPAPRSSHRSASGLAWVQRVPEPWRENPFVCCRLPRLDFKEETRLSRYMSLRSVSWRIYFWGFVNFSAPWRRGHDHPDGVAAPVFVQLGSQWPVFFMRFTWRCSPPPAPPTATLVGWEPPSRVGPCACLLQALIHQRSLPAEQQVRDLVTRLFVGRVSGPHRGNWFILPPITHPVKVFHWPGLPSRRQSKGLWGMRKAVWVQLIEYKKKKEKKKDNFAFVAASRESTASTSFQVSEHFWLKSAVVKIAHIFTFIIRF